MPKKYKLDFKDISAGVDIRKLAEFLGMTYVKRSGDELRFSCPACHSERELCIDATTREWSCHKASCGIYGKDLVALAAAARGTGQYQAAVLINRELLRGQTTPSEPVSPRTTPQAPERRANGAAPAKAFDVQAFAAKLNPEHESLAGMDPEKLRQYRCGYVDFPSTIRGMLAVPLYDGTTITDFLGIPLDGQVKWPKSFKAS